jgi:hypothetical protein
MTAAGERYRHFKTGNTYRVVALGKDADTLEDLVIYEAEYENPESKVWVRRRAAFEGQAEWPKGSGLQVPRFARID